MEYPPFGCRGQCSKKACCQAFLFNVLFAAEVSSETKLHRLQARLRAIIASPLLVGQAGIVRSVIACAKMKL